MKKAARKSKTGAVKRTISMPPRIFKQAEQNAAEQNRNLSNYIATLIGADSLSIEAEAAK